MKVASAKFWRSVGAAAPAAPLALAALLAVSTPAAAGNGPARAAAGVEQAGTCGAPGQPPCPLQGFMRGSVAAPLSKNDLQRTAAGLERIVGAAPDPRWANWAAFAMNGAAAARRGDLAGARAACAGCHGAFRDAYRANYRTRPVR